jgi:hypothetical protein
MIKKLTFTALASIVFCHQLTHSKLAAAPAESVEVRYRFKDTTITLHEPTILMFTVHNGLQRPIAVDLGVNKAQSFEFTLRTPQGRALGGLPQVSEGFYPSGEIIVSPGGRYEQEVILNDWFPFDLPGKYSLTAGLRTQISVDGESSMVPASEHLLLEIKPRSPIRLRELCADLTRQITEAHTALAARDPALILSHIADSVAVPYLAQALFAHKGVESIALTGLERIGNKDAIEEMMSALRDKFGDTSAMARQALSRMQGQISDPSLRERVRRALASGTSGHIRVSDGFPTA